MEVQIHTQSVVEEGEMLRVVTVHNERLDMVSGKMIRTAVLETVEHRVQRTGLCPICGTGRSQYGECRKGHIVLEAPRR